MNQPSKVRVWRQLWRDVEPARGPQCNGAVSGDESRTTIIRGRCLSPSARRRWYAELDLTAYCAKATNEREVGLDERFPADEAGRRHHHSTMKPLALMRHLVRLVTPPGGVVLDPFAGSGTTGMACVFEGFGFLGMEQEPAYTELARARITHAEGLVASGYTVLPAVRDQADGRPEQMSLL